MAAEAPPPWTVQERRVTEQVGDQVAPAFDGDRIAFLDASGGFPGMLDTVDFTSGAQGLPIVPGVTAGPAADSSSVVWQGADLQACLGFADGAPSRCLSVPQADSLALAGDRAISSHGNKTIRMIDFGTMRSRVLDASTNTGDRYDPDIDGGQAVWVHERGYAGKYYEPLIVSYDLSTDTMSYLTKTGGGADQNGESVYERRHPSVSGGRVLYQQRPRGAAGGWDIFETGPDSFGAPVVDAPGDQINPSLSGNLVVYQDNRNGHYDDAGNWVGEWDIYLKDLESGVELPVCTAPGDQINPVIVGRRVVWQDNRGGDWEIYSAEISWTQPRLGLSLGRVFWNSYADYVAGNLTVTYRIGNSGDVPAYQLATRGVMASPSSVQAMGDLPATTGQLDAGDSAPMSVLFHVPASVRWFRTSVFVSCNDAAGREIWFPGPLPT